jgi:hypothetical protein
MNNSLTYNYKSNNLQNKPIYQPFKKTQPFNIKTQPFLQRDIRVPKPFMNQMFINMNIVNGSSSCGCGK